MDKNENNIPDRIDAILRYVAGYIFIFYLGFGIFTKTLETSAIIVVAALAALLVGEEKALSVIKGKWENK
jgi:uncharacterized membrane protein